MIFKKWIIIIKIKFLKLLFCYKNKAMISEGKKIENKEYSSAQKYTYAKKVYKSLQIGYKDIKGKIIDKYDLEFIKPLPLKDYLAVWSVEGTGKTHAIMELFKNYDKANESSPFSCCYISNRISTTQEMSNKFKKFKFQNYLECEKTRIKMDGSSKQVIDENVKRIIIQFESLHKLYKSNYDFLIVDEAMAIFLQCYSKTNKTNMNINQKTFQALFKCCKYVIVLDAHFILPMHKFYNSMCNGKLEYIINKRKIPERCMSIHKGDELKYVYYILDCLVNGYKVVVPTNVQKFGSRLVNIIENFDLFIKNFEELRIRKSSLDKLKSKVKYIKYKMYDKVDKFRYGENVEEEFVKYDLIIYTPTITTGIDFNPKDKNGKEDPYFDYIFAYCTNRSNLIYDFVQMLHRIRHLKDTDFNRYSNYNIFSTCVNFTINIESLKISGIKSDYETRKGRTMKSMEEYVKLFNSSFVAEKEIKVSEGYFNEHYKKDCFTEGFFEYIRLGYLSKYIFMDILEHLLDNKGYVIEQTNQKPIIQEVSFFDISDKITIEQKEDVVKNCVETLLPLKNDMAKQYACDIENSMFCSLSREELIKRDYALKCNRIYKKMFVLGKDEFGDEDLVPASPHIFHPKEYIFLMDNEYKRKNLVLEKYGLKNKMDKTATLFAKEMAGKYINGRISRFERVNLFTEFAELFNYSSFKPFELSTEFINNNMKQVVDIVKKWENVFGNEYCINKDSKDLLMVILNKINLFINNWSNRTRGPRKRYKTKVNGKYKNWSKYDYSDIDTIFEKYLYHRYENKVRESPMYNSNDNYFGKLRNSNEIGNSNVFEFPSSDEFDDIPLGCDCMDF